MDWKEQLIRRRYLIRTLTWLQQRAPMMAPDRWWDHWRAAIWAYRNVEPAEQLQAFDPWA